METVATEEGLLEGFESLTLELRLCVYSFLDTRDLLQVSCTYRSNKALILESDHAGVVDLFRQQLLREVRGDLPLEKVDIRQMDWRRALNSWTLKQFRWTSTAVVDTGRELRERYLHRITMHEDGSAYLSSGMGSGRELLNDVWKLDVDLHGNIRYQEVVPRASSVRPVPRFAASFNSVGSRLCLFGGSGDQNAFLNDTLLFDPVSAVWEPVDLAEEQDEEDEEQNRQPKPRWGQASVCFGNRVIVFGGSRPGQAFDDIWVFAPETGQWREVAVEGEQRPCARGGHSATVVLKEWMYIFGGNNTSRSFNDTWRINLKGVLAEAAVGWERVWTGGEVPNRRIGHGSLAVGHRLFIYGGRNYLTGNYYDEFCVLDVRTHVWTHLNVEGPAPRARTGHAVAPHARGMLVFGGLSVETDALGDFALLDLFNGAVVAPAGEDAQDMEQC